MSIISLNHTCGGGGYVYATIYNTVNRALFPNAPSELIEDFTKYACASLYLLNYKNSMLGSQTDLSVKHAHAQKWLRRIIQLVSIKLLAH